MIDLRDGKYQHLRKEQALAFGADALWQRGILLDMSEDIPGIIRVPSYKPYGGKPAVRVPLPGGRILCFGSKPAGRAVSSEISGSQRIVPDKQKPCPYLFYKEKWAGLFFLSPCAAARSDLF